MHVVLQQLVRVGVELGRKVLRESIREREREGEMLTSLNFGSLENVLTLF
jgi:hypothetical protein